MPDVVLHFSEDPTIEVFHPHVPPTQPDHPPAVWAITEEMSPLYWFPRQCPRATCWYGPHTDRAHAQLVLGHTTAARVHAIEWEWLEPMRTTTLYVYELPAETFTEVGGGATSPVTVEPLSVEPVGDLLQRHADAGIELRIVPDVWAFHLAVVDSTLEFSGVRLRNAKHYKPE